MSGTLVLDRDPRASQARFDYEVSRVNIVPPTEAIARHAGKLLAAAGLHGRKYAIVAATALASPAPVTVRLGEAGLPRAEVSDELTGRDRLALIEVGRDVSRLPVSPACTPITSSGTTGRTDSISQGNEPK